jgi:DNA topoisomerase-3
VLGHVMGIQFPESCKDWNSTRIEDLYDIPVLKTPIDQSVNVVQNLKIYSRDIDSLIIWTDCDREGEAIGYDIIDICKAVKPGIDIYRAHFSALTKEDLTNAATNLARPNQNLADAVRVRQEIDLRIGASFTRF